jgi:sugar phosphate isomerase/epimerase
LAGGFIAAVWFAWYRNWPARQQADERGIELEYGTAGIAAEHLRREIRIAARLRSRILRLVLDANGDEPSPSEAVVRLRPHLPDLEADHVTLAIENHDRFKAATLRRVVEELGARHAGVCLDTANSFGAAEGPDVVLETLGPLAVCWHVKDFVVRRPPHRFGFQIEGCPAGRGQLDLPRWVQRLREMNRNLNAIIELWPPPDVNVEAAAAKEAQWARRASPACGG